MQSTEERFWAKVNRADGCWEWTAAIGNDGYGRFFLNGRTVRSHRLAYELLRGAIPNGLQLDHLCRVRSCCNPDHLEPVSNRENTVRGRAGDTHNHLKTHCPARHPYDSENTYVNPAGKRICRTCLAESKRQWRIRQKLKLAAPAKASHCPRGHEFTPENTYLRNEGDSSGRRCRMCERARSKSRQPPTI